MKKRLDSVFSQFGKNGNYELDSLSVSQFNEIIEKRYPKEHVPSRKYTKQLIRMQYDGDNLNISWEISGEDTCEVFRNIISDQQNRISHVIDVGEVMYKGSKYPIYDGRSSGMISKKGSHIKYTVPFVRIPIVINGVESLEFTIDSLYIDSISFINTGRNTIDYTQPTAFYLSNDTICWKKVNVKILNDSVRLGIVFKGNYEELFSFSRQTLQQQNNFTVTWIGIIVKYVLFTIPFWLLWLFVYANRNRIELIDQKFYASIITWIPRLAVFYYLMAFYSLYGQIDQLEIGESSVSSLIYFKLILHRAIGIAVFAGLLVAAKLLQRNYTNTLSAFCRRFFTSLLAAMVIYTFWGFLNYLIIHLFPAAEFSSGFYDCMLLGAPRKYPYGLMIPGYALLFICFYYLFRFNQAMLLVFSGILAFLFATDLVSALSKLNESSDSGIQSNLNWAFFIHDFLLLLIPIVLTTFLLKKIDTVSEKVLLASSGVLYLITFCCYSVSSAFTFLFIPVTFILAVAISYFFLFVRGIKERFDIVTTGEKIFDIATKNKTTYFRLFELKQFEKIKEKYQQKFNSGELTPSEFDQATEEVDQKISSAYGGDENNKILLRRMEFGVFKSCWKNAERAWSYTATISACVLLFIYAKVVIQYESAFLGIDRAGVLILIGMKLTLAGFTLGYFFPFIKGDTGWKKGLLIGLAITVAELPYNYLTTERVSLQLLVAPLISNIFIMTLTGFLAFDLKTIKDIYGKKFKLKHIAQVEGWRNITALSSVIIGAIIAAVSAFLADNISLLLQSFIDKK